MRKYLYEIFFVIATLAMPGLSLAQEGEFLFGVGTHFPRYKERSAAIKNKLWSSNFNALRDEFSWNSTETVPGRLAINSTHQDLYSLTKSTDENNRIKPILILGLGDLVSPSFPSTVASISAFSEYSRYIVRNSSGVDYFQLGNEWNIGGGLGGRSSPFTSEDYYLRMARSVVPDIRAERRGIKIISAGLGDKDNAWLSRMMTKGGKDIFDGVALHPYNFSEGKNSTPENAYQYVRNTVSQLTQISKRPVSIYITEMGWPNHIAKNGVSQTVAEQYSIRFSLLVRTIPEVKAIMFYDFVNDGRNVFEREENFGLHGYDLSEKPIYKSLNCIAPLIIHGTNFSYKAHDNSLHEVSFEHNSKYYVAIWGDGRPTARVAFSSSAPIKHVDRVKSGSCLDLTHELAGLLSVSQSPLLVYSSGKITSGVISE